MQKQEELTSLKAISTLEFSPAIWQELWKAVTAKKRTKAIASSKAKASCMALIKRHSTTFTAESEAKSSRKISQQLAGTSKAEEHSSSGG
jgi:hypothetical protein